MMTVLITGASSGIGAGLAKSFAADATIWSSPAGAMRRAWQRSSSSAPTSAYACSI